MTPYHASTELRTAATAAAKLEAARAWGLGLGLDAAAWLQVEAGLEDTSG